MRKSIGWILTGIVLCVFTWIGISSLRADVAASVHLQDRSERKKQLIEKMSWNMRNRGTYSELVQLTAVHPDGKIRLPERRGFTRSTELWIGDLKSEFGVANTSIGPLKRWQEKLGGNQARDRRTTQALYDLGWRQATVWECALKGKEKLPLDEIIQALESWLRSDETRLEIPTI